MDNDNRKIKILIENSVPYLSNNSNEISSTNVYLFNIVKNLSNSYNNIDIIVLTNWDQYVNEFNKLKNVKVIFSKIRNPFLWLNFIVPFYWLRNKVDIIFYWKSATSFFPIPWINIISTIHWLIYKIMPETSSKIENIYWRFMAKIAYLVSKKVIVVSDNDFKDLVEDWCDPKKIEKIYIWLDEKYFLNNFNDTRFLNEYNLESKEYFLQVWWISIKKNQDFTLKMFIKILEKYKNYKMVFIWPILDNEYYLKLNQIIKENNLADKVIFTKWINQNIEFDKFISLVRNSKMLYFPSLYEWFWIPPLEAISQKIPSLISDRGSLKEVYWEDNTLNIDLDLWFNETIKILENNDYKNYIINKQTNILDDYKWKNIIKIYYNLFAKYHK